MGHRSGTFSNVMQDAQEKTLHEQFIYTSRVVGRVLALPQQRSKRCSSAARCRRHGRAGIGRAQEGSPKGSAPGPRGRGGGGGMHFCCHCVRLVGEG